MGAKKLLSGLLFSLLTLSSFSQDEIWYFGASKDGLDFSGGGAPTPIQVPWGKGPSGFYECNASVSDGFGTLLFYTDGLNIYNKNHDAMPNGSGLSGPNEPGQTTGSSSQGVIIVQDPGNSDRYYVLYADCIHNNFADGYRYTIVDMTLDGGNGDVVPAFKDLVIMSGAGNANQVGEFLNAVCVGGTTWVLSHRVASNEFLAHRIDATGINLTPVVSSAGPILSPGGANLGNMRGTMSFSHNGQKIALASGGKGVFTFDFNAFTGVVSNADTVASGGSWYYGTEWSPDNSKLYYTNYIGGTNPNPALSQYDVATKATYVYPGSSTLGSIRLAPDGKIYGAPGNPARTALSVINDPDNLGAASNYVVDQQGGFSGGWITLGLPDNFVCIPSDTCKIDSVVAVCDTNSAFQFTANPSGGVWGGGPYITAGGMFDPSVAGAGTHWITYNGGCVGPDSVQITVNQCCPNINPNLGNNLTICDDATHTLDAGSGFASYEWIENGVVMVGQTGSTITADSGTYIVNIEDADGCPGTDTIEIGNWQLPVVDLGPDTSYCAGGSFTLDAGAFASWNWTPGGETTQTITVTSANTYGVTVTDGNGCTNTDDVVVSEWALPVPTITGNAIVCADSSTQITGVAGSAGTLAWSGITPFTNPLSVTAGGTYTLIETDGNGCIDSVDHVVTLEALPAVSLGGPYEICYTQGSQVLDASTGAGGETYLWNDNSTDPTLTVTDSSTVSVIVTSANGCIAYDTAYVDTFSLPVVDLGPDTFYCEASSITLDAGSFTSWAWTPNSETTQTITVSSANTYGVTVTDANGCTNTDDVVISENALPAVDLGPDTTICEADSITLDATHADAATYAWTPNSETSATIKVGSTAGTYGVTITDVDGCVFTTDRTISEEALPIVNLGADDIICDDQTKTLDAGAGAAGYAWYLDGSLLGSETSQTLDADSGIYVVSVTTPLGCETRDTVYIDNHQLPIVNLGGPYEYCEFDSVQLDAGNAGATFAWTPNSETTQTVWAKSATTYGVTVTDGNGCIASSNVVVSENANPVVNIGANDSACVGLPIPLDATIPNGVTYTWSNGHNQATYSLVGPDTLSVIAIDANGCIGYDTLEIAALDSLEIQFGDTTLECENDIQPIDAGTFSGAAYTWTLPNGSTDMNQTIVPNEEGWHIINVTDQYNCKGLDSIYVVIIPVPNIDLGPDTMFCSLGQDRYTIRMEFTQNIAGVIDWNDGGDNNNSNDTLFTATYAPSTVIGQFIDNATGCIHRDSVQLTEFCEPTEIILPNIFVPGGIDNPTFHPIGVTDGNYKDIVNNIVWSDFQVYNRWGLKVFQSKDLLPRWDGMYENRPVATGTYFWIFKYKDSSLKEYTYNGFVQVVQQRD